MAYARAYNRASEQTISNDTLTKILIDTPAGDPNGFFSQANLGFAVPTGFAGLYVVQVTGFWEASTDDEISLRQVEIRSGNYPIGGDTKLAQPAMASWVSVVASAVFNVGDVITVYGKQTSGMPLKFRQAAVLMFAP